MSHRLDIQKWIRLNTPVYATAVSKNGQYVVAGTERGMGIYDGDGRELMRYPPVPTPLPVMQLALDPDMGHLVIGVRQGNLLRLDLQLQGGQFTFQERTIYWSQNDLHSLSARGDKLAVGHLSPGLAVLRNDGTQLWRRHPDQGSATEGRVWSVAIDKMGKTVYAGSSKTDMRNELAAFDVRKGAMRDGRRYVDGRITKLVVLQPGKGEDRDGDVAVVLTDEYGESRLLVYDSHLQSLIWERDFEDAITAIAADSEHSTLVVSVGYDGRLHMLDINTGESAAPVLPLNTLVNDLAIQDGRYISAATENGHLVLLSYR